MQAPQPAVHTAIAHMSTLMHTPQCWEPQHDLSEGAGLQPQLFVQVAHSAVGAVLAAVDQLAASTGSQQGSAMGAA
jgi:hypothetical protein